MSALPIWLRVVLWLAASLAAIAWSEKACRALREPDSRRIVLDEVIGVWTALVWFDDLGWPAALVGLVAFRVLDILKPPPADRLHKHGEGGLSVVLDDIIAGLWSVPLVILVRWLVG
jgi:phosphatidylglycerophosphatase A